ncbi:MAG: acyl-CoA thioesterase [Candidatus Wallbacteria bacterium]|nr:acyl-CoA thioesterase [Candidatus Wallbacteria bacterium]
MPHRLERPTKRVEFIYTRWYGEIVQSAETEIEVRVRYAETDAMGVVYHANHLVWFEMGRVDWLDRLGLPYREVEARGLGLPVIEAAVHYLAPARFDDRLKVVTRLVGMTKARARFAYRLLGVEGNLMAEGYSDHAVVDREMRPIRAPDWLRAKMSGLDALNEPSS